MCTLLAFKVPADVTHAGATALQRAIAQSGLKQEVAAALMGVSYQKVQQWCNGVGHPPFGRLLMMAKDPDGCVCLWYLLREAGAFAGFEDLDALACEAQRLVAAAEGIAKAVAARRMVKAELRRAEQDRRSA